MQIPAREAVQQTAYLQRLEATSRVLPKNLPAATLAPGSWGALGDARLEVGDLGDELHGTLAGDEVVLHHAAEGDHGKAAVLDLSDRAAVGLEAEGIEAVVAGAVELAVEGLLDEGDLEREEEREHLLGGANLDELSWSAHTFSPPYHLP